MEKVWRCQRTRAHQLHSDNFRIEYIDFFEVSGFIDFGSNLAVVQQAAERGSVALVVNQRQVAQRVVNKVGNQTWRRGIHPDQLHLWAVGELARAACAGFVYAGAHAVVGIVG